MIALEYSPFCSAVLNKTIDKTVLEMRVNHQSMTRQILHINFLDFSQPIIHILHLLTKFDNVSLSYKNMYMLGQGLHILSIFIKQNSVFNTKMCVPFCFDDSAETQYTI